ncbi:MAG: class I SAM-dependent methyltransferase [Myxococcota bacterium]
MEPPPTDQRAYWNRVADAKTFHHPLDARWLPADLGRNSPILDVGCGYGRLVSALRTEGFGNVVGVDTSAAMVARGLARDPALDLRVVAPGPLPFADGGFAAAILFSVLTCIPNDAAAEALVGELRRVLRPGGHVLVSDLSLQSDERNRTRYAAADGLGGSGVFTLPEGVVLRHFERSAALRLFADFQVVRWVDFDVVTMNGNAAKAFRFLARAT